MTVKTISKLPSLFYAVSFPHPKVKLLKNLYSHSHSHMKELYSWIWPPFRVPQTQSEAEMKTKRRTLTHPQVAEKAFLFFVKRTLQIAAFHYHTSVFPFFFFYVTLFLFYLLLLTKHFYNNNNAFFSSSYKIQAAKEVLFFFYTSF